MQAIKLINLPRGDEGKENDVAAELAKRPFNSAPMVKVEADLSCLQNGVGNVIEEEDDAAVF